MLIGKLPWGMILNWREVFQVKKKNEPLHFKFFFKDGVWSWGFKILSLVSVMLRSFLPGSLVFYSKTVGTLAGC